MSVATTWPLAPTRSASQTAMDPRPAPISRHRQPGWTSSRRRRESGSKDIFQETQPIVFGLLAPSRVESVTWLEIQRLSDSGCIYFQRFPELKNNRYYAVRAANALLLVLDSSMAELSGPQGEWLVRKLDNIPSEVEFVFVFLHHPPYTSSSDKRMYGGGHSARSEEQELGKMLEKR